MRDFMVTENFTKGGPIASLGLFALILYLPKDFER